MLLICSFDCTFRSSITRLSVDDKVQRSKDVSSQERDLLHKTIVERKGELESPDVEVKPFTKDDNNQTSRALPGYSPPHLEEKTNRKTLTVVNADGELEEVKNIIIVDNEHLHFHDFLCFEFLKLFLREINVQNNQTVTVRNRIIFTKFSGH